MKIKRPYVLASEMSHGLGTHYSRRYMWRWMANGMAERMNELSARSLSEANQPHWHVIEDANETLKMYDANKTYNSYREHNWETSSHDL